MRVEIWKHKKTHQRVHVWRGADGDVTMYARARWAMADGHLVEIAEFGQNERARGADGLNLALYNCVEFCEVE